MPSSKYHTLLANLYRRCQDMATEMPSVARMMHLVGLATEAMEVKNFFETDVLARIIDTPLLDIDIDVDYQEWANRGWPSLHSEEKTGVYTDPQKYFKADADPTLPNSYEDRLLRFFPDVDDTPYAFKAHEQVRTIIGVAASGILMNELHLEQAVNEILKELRIVLSQIQDTLGKKRTREQYKKLFDAEQVSHNFSPVVFEAKQEFNKWKEEECYDDPNAEQLEDYRILILMDLFNSGIFSSRLSSALRTHKRPEEIDFDSLDDEMQKNFGWKNYDEIRKLMDYKDSMLIIGESHRLGQFFYNQRKEPDAAKYRDAFFKFTYKLRYVQDEMKKLSGEHTSEEVEVELNYFAPKINLQSLLKGGWFAKFRTNEKYDEKWTDAFVEALMESKWRDDIARDWSVQREQNKNYQIRGYIVGLLKNEGVLKGSYDSIAQAVDIMDNPRTFSKYMGKGKKQPYADWVKDYVVSSRQED